MENVKPMANPLLDPGNVGSEVKIPTNRELYEFFNQFLLMWIRKPSKLVDWVEGGISDLPLERGLMFFQPLSGFLVIRTSQGFEAQLEKLTTDGKSEEAHMELFVEMVILFWHRFVSKFWGLDSRTLPPVLFKKSVPLDWPDREPDTACVVFVDKEPVEIRIWAPISENETARWRKPRK
jgi:hypothetical protein